MVIDSYMVYLTPTRMIESFIVILLKLSRCQSRCITREKNSLANIGQTQISLNQAIQSNCEIRQYANDTGTNRQLTPKPAPWWHPNLVRFSVWPPPGTIWVDGVLAICESCSHFFVRVKQLASGDNLLSAQNNVERICRPIIPTQ